MAVVLEVKSGPMSGEKIIIRTGETVTFGRASGKANFALPHDTFMSGLHFAVECGPQGPFLKDRNSSNGTFLNGARLKDSPLTNGDEIRSGQTSFSVRLIADDKLPGAPQDAAPPPRAAAPEPPRNASAILDAEPRATARPQSEIPQAKISMPPLAPVAAPQIPRPTPPPPPVPPPSPNPQPPQPPPARPEARLSAPSAPFPAQKPIFTVGSWAFSVVPQGWTVKDEFGMERAGKGDGFPTSLTATEEMVAGNTALGPFVESQLSMLRQYLKDPKIEAAIPPAIPGAQEKASVDVRYSTNDGKIIFYRRLYARSANTIGTITLMTLDADFPSIRPAFDAIVAGVAFQAPVPA
ncbi:MAG: FHA domain-containing protein [Candidatus Acidiferrales bacterium]